MEKFFQDMKALYSTRRLSDIDGFLSEWVSGECVVMGTALGELMLTQKDVRGLFDSDLRYWYDLTIDADTAVREEFGSVSLLASKAKICYNIRENAKRYEGYCAWCKSIAEDNSAKPSVKAAEIAFILDTLLSSRKHTLRKNRLPLTVRALMRGGKAVLISFAFDKDIDSADHYIGDGEDTEKSLAEERELLSASAKAEGGSPQGGMPQGGMPQGGSPEVAEYLRERGYEDAACSARGAIFFGTALERRRDTLEAAMRKVLASFVDFDDGGIEGEVYQELYALRLRIAYLEKVYAIEKHPRAVVRFFGVVSQGKVALFVPTYPLGSYLEWN